jgi:hypothetical protein
MICLAYALCLLLFEEGGADLAVFVDLRIKNQRDKM